MKLAILSLLLAAACAAEIRVTSGASDDQVFQRDAANRAAITLGGESNENGKPVEARLVRKHEPLTGWAAIGAVASGKWSGSITAPTGGPYRIELRAGASTAAVSNVLVGDLWILAGQSNMEGVGDLIDVEQPHELVHNFDLSDRWVVAEEPLHWLRSATDPVHWAVNPETKQRERLTGEKLKKYIANRKKGAGLGMPFAVEMVRRTGVPVGLLSCAHGGTSMDQWSPDLLDKGGESLYGSMIRRVRATGGKASGLLWYQGESDANPKAAPEFAGKFERLVLSTRRDLQSPDLPFYWVQIGRHVNTSNIAEWNAVQEAQRTAEQTIARGGMITAVDASLDDGIHVGTPDLKRLGKRFANLATGSTKRGPRPLSAAFANGVIRVVFGDVNGRLVSQGRISGFSIHGADGAALASIYKARVDPADPSVILLSISGKLPEGATLRYGAGKDPYCNVRDTADMALPVFGPMAITQ